MRSLVFPAFFLFLMWFVKFIEFGLDIDLNFLGIYPFKIKGIPGIFTAPLVHDDIKHLFDNSLPVFFLSIAIFYFYREVAFRVFFRIYLITGLLVWLIGREAYHIGASGLVYGFATFLFTSGIIRHNRNLMAISLLVVFLYGSLVWGLLPYDYRISWESHLMGTITGIILAFIYRSKGPKPDIMRLEEEEEEEEEKKEKEFDEVDKIYLNRKGDR